MYKYYLFLILVLSSFQPFLPTAQAQITVAVLELDNKGVSQIEASALTDRLRDELVVTGRFTVVERQKMNQLLEEQGLQLSGCTSTLCIVKAGEILGVGQMRAGSVSKVGNVYYVSARIVDSESGEIYKVAMYDHKGDIGVLMTDGMGYVAGILAGKEIEKPTINKPSIKTIPHRNAPTQYSVGDTIATIIKIDGDNIMLDIGKNNGVGLGRKLDVRIIDSAVINPLTQDTLESFFVKIADLIVYDSKERYSWALAKLVDSSQTLNVGLFAILSGYDYTQILPKISVKINRMPLLFVNPVTSAIPSDKPYLDDYWILTTEVTQLLWKTIMESNPSEHKGANLPVGNVSYNDIQEFIRILNDGRRPGIFRLPTGIEWEFACQCDNASINYLNDYSWYDKNSGERPHNVGSKKPNIFGIYDMLGNVSEWCADNKVRGGGYSSRKNYVVAHPGIKYHKSKHVSYFGFRLVWVPE